MFAPVMKLGVMLAQGDLDRWAQGSLEERNGHPGGRVASLSGRSASIAVIGPREIATGGPPAHRNG